MQEQELVEQPDGGVPVEAANDRARPDDTRESQAGAPDRDADRRALADALRFFHSGDDPESFGGQFDPFDGGRMEWEQNRRAPSSPLTDRPGIRSASFS